MIVGHCPFVDDSDLREQSDLLKHGIQVGKNKESDLDRNACRRPRIYVDGPGRVQDYF